MSYEIVGLTREQAIKCGELLAGGSIVLDRGRAWITDTLQIRPAHEPSNFHVSNGPQISTAKP